MNTQTDEGMHTAGPVDRIVRRPEPERVTLVCVLEQQRYRPGDQAPEGYLAWHEWAEVQHKAGLRQKQCGRCGLWRYPQQLSSEVMRWEGETTRGKTVQQEATVCNKCAAPPDSKTPNGRDNRKPGARDDLQK